MKKRIICWGKDVENQKLFFTFDLQTKENRVDIHVIPGGLLTQEFENLLANQWRNGGEAQFPEGTLTFSKDLTVTEPITPEGYEVDNPQLLKRSQTEWNFMVMSQKLADLYHQEVEDIKEKIEGLTAFESPVWESLKTFWEKVNGQIREKNLLRHHANELHDLTNSLFEQMKELRKKMDTEFRSISENNKNKIATIMEEIEAKIESGLSLQPIFNQLKKVQNDLKKVELTKGHRRKLWDRIDRAFKTVKTKRYGDPNGGQSEGGGKSRLQHRYDGLLEVINRMERSMKRDRNDMSFQSDRVNTTSGQLEAEIRKAKMQMIEERVNSKQLKLDDMLKTKVDLEKRLEKEKEREATAKARKLKQELIEKAKAEVEQKIAEEITGAKADRAEELEKLLSAASAINASRNKTSSKPKAEDGAPGEEKAGEITEQKEETKTSTDAKIEGGAAVKEAQIVEKAGEDGVTEQTAETKASSDAKITSGTAAKEATEGDEELTVSEFVSDKLEDIVDTARAVAGIVGHKIGEALEDLAERLQSDEEE